MKYLLALCIAIFTCQCTKGPQDSKTKPLVVTTIAPYVEIISEIAQDTVNVKTLFPPNVDAHSYEPSHVQIDDLKKSAIWFYLGEPQERKLLSVVESQKTIQKIDLTQNITLHSSGHHKDYHIWTSPKLMKVQAETIFSALSESFPEYQDIYRKNYETLLEKLDHLDETIRAKIGPSCPNVLISHNALLYFGEEFGCSILSLDSIENYSAKDQKLLMQEIKKKDPCLFIIIPQHHSKSVKLLAKKLKIPVVYWNPYEKKYFKNLIQLVEDLSHENCHQHS